MKNKVISDTSEKLPKSHKLLKWKNFHFKGKVFKKSLLKVSFKNNLFSHPRLGIVVSKKVSKSAVVRNKIRRVLKESFRTSLLKSESLDVVLIVTRPFVKENESFYKQLRNTFLNIEKEILWAQTKKEA